MRYMNKCSAIETGRELNAIYKFNIEYVTIMTVGKVSIE